MTTSNPPTKTNTPLLSGANMPRATATTIVRPPTSYPLTIKSPGSGNPVIGTGMSGNTTSIRLTSASQGPSSVQLVPMSLPSSIRPQVKKDMVIFKIFLWRFLPKSFKGMGPVWRILAVFLGFPLDM